MKTTKQGIRDLNSINRIKDKPRDVPEGQEQFFCAHKWKYGAWGEDTYCENCGVEKE